MSKGLTELLTKRIEEAIVDVPASLIVRGIVSEIGFVETIEWLRPIAKDEGWTITIERRV